MGMFWTIINEISYNSLIIFAEEIQVNCNKFVGYSSSSIVYSNYGKYGIKEAESIGQS